MASGTMTVNDELDGMQVEVVMAYCEDTIIAFIRKDYIKP
jgi:hypothetical protein